ncbi:MAG: arginine repressor [Christensenellaceae bacterium]|jgi:transcriptional regulator of arginine metabolism|nr:arginine repressor [Christensenellaceae bacterium]
MKAARHALIQEIIERQRIQTQEELANLLKECGILVTQATVSRDIKELRLLKVLTEDGSYRYATADKAEGNMADRFIRMFHDSVLSVSQAGNLLVLKTLPGSANVAAETIDTMRWSEVVGTIGGDNTILVILSNEEDATEIRQKFLKMMR